ncbi:MAG: hypothetical protein Q8L48_32520 [Archangium sp.]|nr:hypothetical protein [Archangium sp.]
MALLILAAAFTVACRTPVMAKPCTDDICQGTDPGRPYCDTATSTCVVCRADGDCASSGTGKHCNAARTACVACRDHNDCAAVGEYCDAATSQCRVGCTADAPRCGVQVCDTVGKVCVGCLTDANCGADKVCEPVTKTCVGCNADADCGQSTGRVCRQTACVCIATPNSCGAGRVCDTTANACVQCLSAADCAGLPGLRHCDAMTKTCVACLPTNDDCPANQYCDSSMHCVAGCKLPEPAARECAAEQFCNVQHTCVLGCMGTGQSTCAPGQTCQLGACFENTWTLRPTSGTAGPALGGAAFVADTVNNQLIVFGGENATGQRDELWTLTFGPMGEPVWQQRLIAGARPTARTVFGAAFDSQRGRLVIHGGNQNGGCSNYLGETWALDVATMRWTRIWDTSMGTPGPGRVNGNQLAYDPVRGVIVAFGGQAPDSPAPCFDVSTTWELSGNTWTQIVTPPARTPSGRVNMMLATDPTSGRVFMFGGHVSISTYAGLAETWVYDGTGWDQLPGVQPPGRDRAAFAYEPVRKKLVLFGGYPAASSVNNPLGDTWEFDVTSLAWSQGAAGMAPLRSPSPRQLSHAAALPGMNRLVLFGGMTSGYVPSSEVWVYGGP